MIDEQNVYAVSQDGVIYAFDKATGAQIWQNKTMQYRSMSIPAILGNGVLVVDNDGYVHMFNRNDGQEMARISTSLTGGVSYPVVRDNGVIYQSAGGYVALIKIIKEIYEAYNCFSWQTQRWQIQHYLTVLLVRVMHWLPIFWSNP